MNKKELFLKKFDQIKDLPTLPAIVLKVNQMLDSPDTNMEILSHVIEKDQAIAFKMLRLVNSAFFGLRDKISSIREAAIILGFDAIRNIVISLSTYNTLNSIAESRSHTDFKVDGFWRHSISVAVLSRFLSEKKQLGDPEKSFVSGLLHDMGKMILAYYFPESFKKILVLSQKKRIIYRKAEERILPGGHHEIGYYIAKKWDIPIHIANTLYSHHNLEIGATTYEDCLIVNTADAIINSYTSDFLNNNMCPDRIDNRYFNEQVRKEMKLWIDSSPKWFPEVNEMIEEAFKLFFEK